MRERQWTPTEQQTWSLLYGGLNHCRKQQAHPYFGEGLHKLGITGEKIPSLEEVNQRLHALTGWRGIYVKGLEDGNAFFTGLSRREFPIGCFIRNAEDLAYTPAPDVFHDLYGHLPLLAHAPYATFCYEIGCLALNYLEHPDILRQFERIFWFAVEFPLIDTADGRRIFGGGILSSQKESDYSLSAIPEVRAFDIDEIRHREFQIDRMQEVIYCLKSETQLYESLSDLRSLLAHDQI